MQRSLLDQLYLDLSEEDGRELLIDAYRDLGWQVKHLHALEPRFEQGADFRAEKVQEVVLAAVKKRPVTRDIPQLQTLAARLECTKRLYFSLLPPTEPFMKALRAESGRVELLGQDAIHKLLLEGEVVDYLIRVFRLHPLVNDMARVLSTIWSSRAARRDGVEPTDEELGYILRLKDATLKLRASLTFASLRWDEVLMNKNFKDAAEYPSILDRAMLDLSLVRRFVGPGLLAAFDRTARRLPHVLASFWSLVRPRTNWDGFVHQAERKGSVEDFIKMAKHFWLMPSEAGGYEPHRARENMVGFYSSIVHVFQNLARVSNDLELGMDWTLNERFPKIHQAVDAYTW